MSLLSVVALCQKFETQYVKSDYILVRKSPEMSGEVWNVIPYGSKVEVHSAPASSSKDAEEEKQAWVYEKNTGGYILAKSLQSELPTHGEKTLTWKSQGYTSSCQGHSVSKRESLVLSGGRAEYRVIGESDGDKNDTVHVGTYTFSKNEMILELGTGTSTITTDGQNVHTETIDPQKIRFIYVDKAQGFVLPEHQSDVNNPEMLVELKECHFLSKDSDRLRKTCEKDTPAPESDVEKEYTVYGYLCIK